MSEWRRRTVAWVEDECTIDVQSHLTLILVCRQLLPRNLVVVVIVVVGGGRGAAEKKGPCNMSAAAPAAR